LCNYYYRSEVSTNDHQKNLSEESMQVEDKTASPVITEECKPTDAETTVTVGTTDTVTADTKSAVQVDAVPMPTGPKTR